ncbi:hypothetical protein OCHUTO_0723 [Orientia chuto str. Dubai]|uniref:Uncharacterized protein n=1 Tax=Orientia chuto str. Dubai TaxID=1359168 RepID=A0A0F3MH46_9RICK|nr:hypothetical protein OCHUTO_1003 [Orientia chuto str. Dubai]KJV55728.1 hypothetical protein OCHUTO_0723 [Orientia chuto str. Dubai]
MPIEDEGQNKINKLTKKLATEGINSTTKQIDAELTIPSMIRVV